MNAHMHWTKASLLAIGVSMATMAVAATQAKARTEPTVQESTKTAPPAATTAMMPPAASTAANPAQVAAPQSAVVARASFATLDKDKDGRVSSTEADADPGFSGSFAAMDANGDGFVNDDEYRAHAKATAKPDEWKPTGKP